MLGYLRFSVSIYSFVTRVQMCHVGTFVSISHVFKLDVVYKAVPVVCSDLRMWCTA